MLAKSHRDTDPIKRKPKKQYPNSLHDKYLKVDLLVDKVFCDYINGECKSVILSKLQNGDYDNKPLKLTQSYEYLNAAINRIKYDQGTKEEELRNVLMARLEEIYRSSMEIGNHMTAISALKEIKDLFLPKQPQNQTNIQVNNGEESNISINFGYLKSDEN